MAEEGNSLLTQNNTDGDAGTGDQGDSAEVRQAAFDALPEGDRQAMEALSDDDKKTLGDMYDESQQSSDGAPESYADFAMPEGVTLDTKALEGFMPVAKELNLTQDQAQKLVDVYAKQLGSTAEAVTEKLTKEFIKTREEWQGRVKSDEDMGGAKFQDTMVDAKKAVQKFGTPELNKALDEYGWGDHPEMIRMLSKVGAALKEDSASAGDEDGGTPKSRASVLFPDQEET